MLCPTILRSGPGGGHLVHKRFQLGIGFALLLGDALDRRNVVEGIADLAQTLRLLRELNELDRRRFNFWVTLQHAPDLTAERHHRLRALFRHGNRHDAEVDTALLYV